MISQRAYIFSACLHVIVILLIVIPVSFSIDHKPLQQTVLPVTILPVTDKTHLPKTAPQPVKKDTKTPKTKAKQVKKNMTQKPELVPEEPKPKKEPEKKETLPDKTKKPVDKKTTTEKKTPQKKKNDKKKPKKEDDFLSVLKTVEDLVSEEQDAPKKDVSNPHGEATLDEILSLSELDALRQQLSRCWSLPAGAKHAGSLVVQVRVTMNPNATVKDVVVRNQSDFRGNDFFTIASESAVRALYHPDCTPLKLPLDKYEQWKSVIIDFDPQEMFR